MLCRWQRRGWTVGQVAIAFENRRGQEKDEFPMKRLSYLFSVPAITAVLLFVTPSQAHAYLDPGSGSYIFQLLLAALVGALFAIRIYWGRIKSFFRKLFSEERDGSEDEE